MDDSKGPEVYVVILNWNGWQDTIECLESLFRSRYTRYRVVVCDNGSDDGSLENIKAWAEGRLDLPFSSDNPLRYLAPIPKPVPYVEHDREVRDGDCVEGCTRFLVLVRTGANLGFAGGNNVGIRYALERKADYVWLLNNDTVTDLNALGAMVNVAQSDPDIGAVGSTIYYMDAPNDIQLYGGGWVSFWLGICRHFTTSVSDDKLGYVAGTSLLLRREVLEQVGLLDDKFFMYWEDTDYGIRVREAGWKLAVAPESRIWHRESAALGKKNPVLYTYFNASAVRFFRKFSPLPFVPISVGVGGRFLKRVMQGDWNQAKAVWQGALAGCRE
ncbi:glycosyltransferase family 2 protein [Rubrobacter xylanophilus]|nr:glycosyltransferase family 2 protein [Rubrobacter xylanophilus]